MKRSRKSNKKEQKRSYNLSLKNEKDINKKKIRLNKFISNSGICSRREADKFIEAGVVTVNGIAITKMGYKINPTDLVKFNSQKVKSETLRYVLLNKPKNYSVRESSTIQEKSVLSLVLSACKEKIYPIDRLNKSETGLLLFTNDTTLSKKIIEKNHRNKSIYQISLNKNLSNEDLNKIRNGVILNGKKHIFDSISHVKNKQKNEIGIENTQIGIKHIKEIFQKLNYTITKLDRVFFCGLSKKNLPRKHFRHLTKDEINILKRL
ncbi:MAG: pseudouridine synthase [Flavobacteriales bacterium]|nr:pseudouridine synthase [Flavobacteriales bacterium]|tara:strand:- start:1367 stop:2158 length:792 start_codon:yes stop_codon:yes gene_type:complete